MPTKTRVLSIDVLRGVSLLGILVMNIQSFAMPHAAYFNPTTFGSLEGLEGVAWGVGRLLFDFKFITLFSTLFGASLVLGGDTTHPRRRLGWLLVFGLLHAYLIWYGDILFTYAVMGLVMLGAREWPVRRQVALGVGLALVPSVLMGLLGIFFDRLPAELAAELASHFDASSVPGELKAFRGGWLSQWPVRAALSFDLQTTLLLLGTGWRAAGCMLLGMAAVRSGVFEGAVPTRPWEPLAWAVGLTVTGLGMGLQWTWDFAPRVLLLAQGLHEAGALVLAAGMGLSVIRMTRRLGDTVLVQALRRLGQVAFTAYLMQSLVGTLVFGGHGLGFFGTWSRSALLAGAFAFWSLQLVLAWGWTSRFRVGPLEALWRGLSRGHFSLGRVEAATALGAMSAGQEVKASGPSGQGGARLREHGS